MARPPGRDDRLKSNTFVDSVSEKEARKLRAGGSSGRSIWFGFSTFGVIGWSVAVPALFGVGLGYGLDRTWPGGRSWMLALLLAGVAVGCANAWYWVSRAGATDDQEDSLP